MPQIAREIQKSGFLIRETQEYVAIRFRYTGGSKSKNAVKEGDYGKPK
jgi:hypothetical protein